ncbi:MAG: phage tail tube protein, partial [Candidatus Marinimicrobia bacterium]|nr:phage tail tube protein [Candidatus Neomarinimicrobiota bacterium]
ITPATTNTDIGNLGFEIANEFDHVFMPTNYLHDELWTDVYSDYSTAGIGTTDDLMIRRMTVGIAKAVSLWVYRACMVNTLKISGNAKSGVQFEYGLIPFDRVTDSLSGSRQDGTTVEGWKTNLTYSNSGLFTPAINERILFSDLLFRIGDYSTDTPLTSDNNLGISAFEININNNLDTSAHDSVSGEYRKVPLRNGKREVTGSFTCPRYVADTFFTKRDANTILMAFLYFTGSTITTISRYLRIFLPSIKVITTTAPIGSSATVPITVTFQAFIPAGQATSSPTYTITNPNPDIIIETGNQNPFNLFRDQNQEY